LANNDRSDLLTENTIWQTFTDFLQGFGYTAMPDRKQFRKPFSGGFKAVMLAVTPYDDDYVFEVTLGTRVDLVEDLVYQFTNGLKGYTPDSNTFAASTGRLSGKRYLRYTVSTTDKFQQVFEDISQQFTSRWFSFLDRAVKVDYLDELYNDRPLEENTLVYNQINRCFRGIVLAFLAHNKNYHHINTAYLGYLRQINAPYMIIENYKKLIAFLNVYSMN